MTAKMFSDFPLLTQQKFNTALFNGIFVTFNLFSLQFSTFNLNLIHEDFSSIFLKF